jgi:hypothetical protein
MPDETTPAPSSLDVAAARDALTWAIGALDALALAYIPEKRREASTMFPRLVALREALPDVNADSMRSLRALVSAVEQAAQIDAKEEIDDNGHAWARVSALVSALGFRFQQAERRASEEAARATRLAEEIAETRIVLGSPSEDLTTPEGARVITRGLEEAHEALNEMTTERDTLRTRLASTERALAEARDDAKAGWRAQDLTHEHMERFAKMTTVDDLLFSYLADWLDWGRLTLERVRDRNAPSDADLVVGPDETVRTALLRYAQSHGSDRFLAELHAAMAAPTSPAPTTPTTETT